MQVKGVIEEENNLFVLLHDNEAWVKATAGNVVKELFAYGDLRVWRHRQCYLVLLMMYIW